MFLKRCLSFKSAWLLGLIFLNGTIGGAIAYANNGVPSDQKPRTDGIAITDPANARQIRPLVKIVNGQKWPRALTDPLWFPSKRYSKDTYVHHVRGMGLDGGAVFISLGVSFIPGYAGALVGGVINGFTGWTHPEIPGSLWLTGHAIGFVGTMLGLSYHKGREWQDRELPRAYAAIDELGRVRDQAPRAEKALLRMLKSSLQRDEVRSRAAQQLQGSASPAVNRTILKGLQAERNPRLQTHCLTVAESSHDPIIRQHVERLQSSPVPVVANHAREIIGRWHENAAPQQF